MSSLARWKCKDCPLQGRLFGCSRIGCDRNENQYHAHCKGLTQKGELCKIVHVVEFGWMYCYKHRTQYKCFWPKCKGENIDHDFDEDDLSSVTKLNPYCIKHYKSFKPFLILCCVFDDVAEIACIILEYTKI